MSADAARNHLAGWGRADVAEPQAEYLATSACALSDLSDMVAAGRTQAAYASHRGQSGELSFGLTLQEHRSRGCPRARKPFWPCAWLHLLQLAPPRKKKSFTSIPRFRPSRPTPASTSKTSGRANGACAPRPAPILSDAPLPFDGLLSGVGFDLGRSIRHDAPLGFTGGRTC